MVNLSEFVDQCDKAVKKECCRMSVSKPGCKCKRKHEASSSTNKRRKLNDHEFVVPSKSLPPIRFSATKDKVINFATQYVNFDYNNKRKKKYYDDSSISSGESYNDDFSSYEEYRAVTVDKNKFKADEFRLYCRELSIMGVKIYNSQEIKFLDNITKSNHGAINVVRVDQIKKSCVGKQFNEFSELLREVNSLMCVQEVPGVQKLIGVCPSKKTMITSYAGKPLNEALRKHKLSLHDKFQLMKQFLKVVQGYLKLKMTHNDLKANNVCLKIKSFRPVLTVIDFGYATNFGKQCFHPVRNEGFNRYDWIAPELISGQCFNSEATEMYGIAKFLLMIIDS